MHYNNFENNDLYIIYMYLHYLRITFQNRMFWIWNYVKKFCLGV